MIPKLKICLVAPGTSVHSKRWAEALRSRGHEVLWVTLTRQSPLDTAVETCTPYASMGRWRPPKLHYLIAFEIVRRRIRKFNPDLVHMHYLDPQRSQLLQSRNWRRFIVSLWGSDIVWADTGPEPASQIHGKQELLSRAQTITVTNQYLADVTMPYLLAPKPVHIVPFGVDTSVFHPADGGANQEAFTVGFAKHFAPTYGPDVLIESMRQVIDRFPQARAILIGDRDPEPYRRQIEALNLSHAVTLRGPVPHAELPHLMRSLDVFCMPSRQESFGVAALEASACCVPVIASDVGGVRDVVKDQETGFLVPPDDADILAARLIELLESPSRSRDMGRAGRRFVRQSFEWNDCVTAMENVYWGAMS